jgi:nucleoside-diphosphate-sugar epimerase
MRVFVTGASGFIGAAVIRLLIEQGVETAALVSNKNTTRLDWLSGRFQAIEGRLSDLPTLRSTLAQFKPDACIHLAWYAEPGKYLYSSENIPSLQHSLIALQTLIDVGCRQFVGVGTCAEYDTSKGYLHEDDPTHPATIYAACKLSMCLIGQQIATSAGVNFAWARLFYLYGPSEDPRRLVPALIHSLQVGKSFEATAGEQIRDYLHLEDVASALITLATQQVNGIYNISSGLPITMRHLMIQIGQMLGKDSLIQLGALPYRQWEPMFICGNNQKLRQLGWKPRYSLETGLATLIDQLL